ncbi:hypothetical protein Mlab_1470 [Methanocorpusculum labreanum Z]|uniref:Uncharacterized protein n=1 Tax=Methanocorpusculum labreanum (strain ATCC 43576 / DSM 4855 / Z) TaxID=410358 RepID=A2STH9_METLZ|nr:hypothetical protein [Methanocorpusculum labreanum]ABN07635.1 hypothetical protein Mlab_1470 [Methanocorpusculum labreanum Z]
MNKNADSGLSEVVSVALILTVLILVIIMWVLIAFPIMGTNAEQVHNGDVFLEFAQMKADVDTVWLSNSTGITRQAVFTLSPAADRTEVTVFPNLLLAASFGTVTLQYGSMYTRGSETYATVEILYTSSNMYAEEINILYDGGTLSQNDRVILSGSDFGSGSYVVVVNTADVPETVIGGSGVATLNYRLKEIIDPTPGSSDVDHLCVFTMGLQ